MVNLFNTALLSLIFCSAASLARAQTASAAVKGLPKAGGQPARPVAEAAELNGYKQAFWGNSVDEVNTALHTDFDLPEGKAALTELPWEIMRLAGISESDPDDLLGADLQWFLGENLDTVTGFYKNRFFFYTAALDKVVPVSEYEKKLGANHGPSTRTLSFQHTDQDEKVTGSYTLKLWEKKKTTIALGTEKLFPGTEPELNYEITYLSADIFQEFKNDFARALEQVKAAEKLESDKALREQQQRALDVIQ